MAIYGVDYGGGANCSSPCISYCNTVFQRVDDLPSLGDATRNHAYITPDNKIYILNADGTGYMQMSTQGGGVTVGLSSNDGSITIVENKNSVTHTFDIKVSEDIINRIIALEGRKDKDTIYDDSELEAKINDILSRIANLGGVYTAGRGLELVGNEFRVICQKQNLAVKYADDEQGTGFRDTPIGQANSNLFSTLEWLVEQPVDPNANGSKLNVATTNNSLRITGSAIAGNDFVYARVEAEPNTEFTLEFDYTSSKAWSQYVDYLYFVASTTRTWGSHLKDLPSIKLPKPSSTHTTPQKFSMDFTVGKQGYIYLYVNHTNSTNYEEVEQTFANFTIRPKNQEASVGTRAKYIGLASVCPDGTSPDQPTEYTWLSLYNETESKTLEELRKQIESNQLVVNQQINQALTEFGEKMVANQGKAYTAGDGITITEEGVISLTNPTGGTPSGGGEPLYNVSTGYFVYEFFGYDSFTVEIEDSTTDVFGQLMLNYNNKTYIVPLVKTNGTIVDGDFTFVVTYNGNGYTVEVSTRTSISGNVHVYSVLYRETPDASPTNNTYITFTID